MKIAIVHDWLAAMRGGERCVEAFCELFPHADLLTLFHLKGKVSSVIEQMPIRTSFIHDLPLVERFYRYYLPLFPYAIERFDLSGFDVILSSSHCVAKGIRRPPGALHISYTYTPMRYAWDLYDAYFDDRSDSIRGRCRRAVMERLRQWDLKACERVDQFVAISHHVADRIKRHYKRDAMVVYPPVDVHRFTVSEKDEGFYLIVSAFAPYKRVDLAIEACNQTKRSLKVIGAGQDFKRIQQLAGPTVELLGWQPDDVVTEYYRRCRALLFPGEEDFGIVPLEAMACGKPVIAFAKGGALETVVPSNPRPEIQQGHGAVGMPPLDASLKNPTGVFFYDQTPQGIVDALELFERDQHRFDPKLIRSHVEPFDRASFKQRISLVINKTCEKTGRRLPC